MKRVECYFTNPYDNRGYKNMNGISLEESDAIVKDEKNSRYVSRNRIIDIIRNEFINGNLINSQVMLYADRTVYVFVIKSEGGEKSKLVINITAINRAI